MRLISFLTLVCIAAGCSADNILVFLPIPTRSHHIQVEPIFHALALRGHNVTQVSPYPPKMKTPNLRHILLSEDTRENSFDVEEMVVNAQSETWGRLLGFSLRDDLADATVKGVMASPVFHDLINGDNHFDLIFTELFYSCQEALVVLGHIFNAPVVTYSSNGYTTEILRYSGAISAPAYLPQRINNYQPGPMSLAERLGNAWQFYTTMLANEFWYFPRFDAILSQCLPAPLPRITDMLRNVSIFFITANIALDGSKLYPPNVVEISGLQIQEPKPLDTELKSIMDSSKHGVIYFSFGTLLKMDKFKKESIQTFLKVFKELDQTVLWKMNLSFSDIEIPQNVHVRDWFDQSSILAHPNCVLFLTHGGLSSTMEAVRYAVPVVGMPFFADQDVNIANAVYRGYGLGVWYKNLTYTSLHWAIKTVLGDPRFKENARKASKIFTDKPVSSLDTAVYWIEYVTKHRGAHHLKPLTVQMPWYQVLLLDVIAIYLLAVLMLMLLITKLFILYCRKIACKSKKLKGKME